MDSGDSGKRIGAKLFALHSPNQKKELVQFVRNDEAGDIPSDVPYATIFQGQQNMPDQPLIEIWEGDLYFCLERRLVTVRSRIIPLTVKEFLHGRLQDFVFPAYDVRYIAINDDVDSAKEENDFAVFKNVFNDYYAKNTRKKSGQW